MGVDDAMHVCMYAQTGLKVALCMTSPDPRWWGVSKRVGILLLRWCAEVLHGPVLCFQSSSSSLGYSPSVPVFNHALSWRPTRRRYHL